MNETPNVRDVQHVAVEAGLPSPDAEVEVLKGTEAASPDWTVLATSGAPRNILVSAAQDVQHDVMCS